MNISDMVQELKTAREMALLDKERLDTIVAAFQESDAYKFAKSEKDESTALVEELEKRIKETAVGSFDGENKHPAPFVNIAMRNVVRIIDVTLAREWCALNLRDAFKLDEKKVEKYVKEIAPIPGVKVSQEPQAQIASVIE